MDFILKKAVSMFMMPLSIGVSLIILGLLLLYMNKIKKAKKVLLLSIVCFVL